MKILLVIFAIVSLFFNNVASVREGFKGYPQDWGFVEVRPGAHSFWWLHYTLANVTNYADRPLIIWLQGGPGGSSTAYGNFEILGPLDLELNEREYTWINNYNVLFIDNPIGTGFSWVENENLLTTNNTQIARDLVELMRGFYKALPEFERTPLHIFGQSYGPKMGVEFAYELHKEIEAGTIKSNLTSVGVGNSFVSPFDSTISWADFLREMGFVDVEGAERIRKNAMNVQTYLDEGQYLQASYQFFSSQFDVFEEANSIDFYNVLNREPWFDISTQFNSINDLKEKLQDPTFYDSFMMQINNVKPEAALSLNQIMSMVHEALELPSNVRWNAFDVFSPLLVDFMKPVVHIVEKLLDETSVKVVVFNGNVDLICATPGTVAWVDRLNWHGKEEFAAERRYGYAVDGILEGYVRRYDNLHMYWIQRAGHSVNKDNPFGMSYVLDETMGLKDLL